MYPERKTKGPCPLCGGDVVAWTPDTGEVQCFGCGIAELGVAWNKARNIRKRADDINIHLDELKEDLAAERRAKNKLAERLQKTIVDPFHRHIAKLEQELSDYAAVVSKKIAELERQRVSQLQEQVQELPSRIEKAVAQERRWFLQEIQLRLHPENKELHPEIALNEMTDKARMGAELALHNLWIEVNARGETDERS